MYIATVVKRIPMVDMTSITFVRSYHIQIDNIFIRDNCYLKYIIKLLSTFWSIQILS
jgi:hypothetical protein